MINSVCYESMSKQSANNNGSNGNNDMNNMADRTIANDNDAHGGGGICKIADNIAENIANKHVIDDINVELSQNNGYISTSSSPLGNSMSDISFASGNPLCTHDGVLLKKANAEYISDINTSGSLSLVEYKTPTPTLHLCLEWRPNENILITDDTQDKEDWALVDTISRRTRTISECSAFNIKPMDTSISTMKPRIIRVPLDELATIDVKHKGQNLRFACKTNNSLHLEFFFQHGNADLFIRSMQDMHVIKLAPTARNQDKYIILPVSAQKLRKTFADLDIGEIKSSPLGNENWLSNKVVEFLSTIPDYVAQKAPPKQRPGALDYKELNKSSSTVAHDNYQMLCLQSNASKSNNQSPASNSSADLESYLENVKEVDEKIISCLAERQLPERGPALNESEWFRHHTIDQRILQPNHVLSIIFRGGIEDDLRPEVWKYLLKFYQWQESECERIAHRQKKSREYYAMKAQWLAMTTIQEANFSAYRDRKCQIEKDVKRSDRSLEFYAGENNSNLITLQGILMTYVMYNFDLGYVQGMSDLLAPILAVMKDEVDAFWCFVGFMDLVSKNFDIDQAGMKAQFLHIQRLLEYTNPRLSNYLHQHDSDNMFFCFRWLLVWFKREFDDNDILHLWECLWTGLPCPNFHLLISIAILDDQADVIIEGKLHFNEILKHINELAGNIDLAHTLQVAEGIYEQLKAAENLPNDIRKIIGLPLIMEDQQLSSAHSAAANEETDLLDESFDALVPELTPEQKDMQLQLLEEACERSMFLQYM